MNGWPDAVTNVNYAALAVGATTLVVMVGWPGRFSRFFPATLVALLAGTLLSLLWLTDVPVIGDVSASAAGAAAAGPLPRACWRAPYSRR